MATRRILHKVGNADCFLKSNYITQYARDTIKIGDPSYDFEIGTGEISGGCCYKTAFI